MDRPILEKPNKIYSYIFVIVIIASLSMSIISEFISINNSERWWDLLKFGFGFVVGALFNENRDKRNRI